MQSRRLCAASRLRGAVINHRGIEARYRAKRLPPAVPQPLFSGLPPPALHTSSAQPRPPVMNLIHVWRYQASGPSVSGEYPNVNQMTLNAAREAFKRGYLDAWSIRGDGLAPPIPAYLDEPGEDPYRGGVARAVRDAARKALATTTGGRRWRFGSIAPCGAVPTDSGHLSSRRLLERSCRFGAARLAPGRRRGQLVRMRKRLPLNCDHRFSAPRTLDNRQGRAALCHVAQAARSGRRRLVREVVH